MSRKILKPASSPGFRARCPLERSCYPDSPCPAAVLRIRFLRSQSKELTEEQEMKAPGCAWAVDNRASDYCFFKYMATQAPVNGLNEQEIAALLNLSPKTVRAIEKSAIAKAKTSELGQELEFLKEEFSEFLSEGVEYGDSHKVIK